LLGIVFYSLGSVPVGADAKRILTVDLEEVGRFIKNVGDYLVIHAQDQGKRVRARELEHESGRDSKRSFAV
jgi:hypothetical protein